MPSSGKPRTPRQTPAKKPDPHARAKPWVRIGRDLSLLAIAVFILMHETISAGAPDPVLIAAALGCLGLPAGLRLVKADS